MIIKITISEKACGDGIVDVGIDFYPDYKEDCDVGKRISHNNFIQDPDYVGFGCDRNCKYVIPDRPNIETVHNHEYVEEDKKESSGTPHYDNCSSIYLPPENGSYYNKFLDGEKKQNCFGGKYCLDCKYPKFPGYPLEELNKFVDASPYKNLPAVGRGRLRALSYNDEIYGFSYVLNNKDVLMLQDGDNAIFQHNVDHNGHPAMRETFGRHFVSSDTTNSIKFYAIEKNDIVTPPEYTIVQKNFAVAQMRVIPPQLGAEFYIWWPGPDYLLSRLYNGRNFEIIPFNNVTYDSFASSAGIAKELLLEHSYIPNFEVLGDIVYYPAFLENKMYMPLAATSALLGETTIYKVNIYSNEKVPWEITLKDSITVPDQILTIASFTGGVVVTTTGTASFYKINGPASAITPSYTGGPPTCSGDWKFIQSRPSPEHPENSPPVYAFCAPYEIYPSTFDGTTLTIDTGAKIELDPDTALPEPGKARFNLDYPYDLNGPFLINFGVYKCSKETGYLYEYWNTLALSYINLNTGNSSHIKVEITENLT